MGYTGLVIPGISCYVKGLVVPGFRYTCMSLYTGVRYTWGFHSKYCNTFYDIGDSRFSWSWRDIGACYMEVRDPRQTRTQPLPFFARWLMGRFKRVRVASREGKKKNGKQFLPPSQAPLRALISSQISSVSIGYESVPGRWGNPVRWGNPRCGDQQRDYMDTRVSPTSM